MSGNEFDCKYDCTSEYEQECKYEFRKPTFLAELCWARVFNFLPFFFSFWVDESGIFFHCGSRGLSWALSIMLSQMYR